MDPVLLLRTELGFAHHTDDLRGNYTPDYHDNPSICSPLNTVGSQTAICHGVDNNGSRDQGQRTNSDEQVRCYQVKIQVIPTFKWYNLSVIASQMSGDPTVYSVAFSGQQQRKLGVCEELEVENIDHLWSKGEPPITFAFPSQRDCNVENGFLSWRYPATQTQSRIEFVQQIITSRCPLL